MFHVDPIGYFHSSSDSLYDVPRQSFLEPGNYGVIKLKTNCQFEQALEGLSGFDLIWVLFYFHRHSNWKPKVLPPRGGEKQGVFATRSPHRPNFIGLSCVALKKIEGLELYITDHDLIDGTPILDIKPYLNYVDSRVSSSQGWVGELPREVDISIEWTPMALKQIDYLIETWPSCLNLKQGIEHRIKQSPLPYRNNRVREIGANQFELAYKTWRAIYRLDNGVATIENLISGYDEATLKGEKKSKWDDVPIHQAFVCYKFH